MGKIVNKGRSFKPSNPIQQSILGQSWPAEAHKHKHKCTKLTRHGRSPHPTKSPEAIHQQGGKVGGKMLKGRSYHLCSGVLGQTLGAHISKELAHFPRLAQLGRLMLLYYHILNHHLTHIWKNVTLIVSGHKKLTWVDWEAAAEYSLTKIFVSRSSSIGRVDRSRWRHFF